MMGLGEAKLSKTGGLGCSSKLQIQVFKIESDENANYL